MFEGLDWETIKNLKIPNRYVWLGSAAMIAYVIWWYHGQYEKAHDPQDIPKPPSVTQQLRFLLDILGH